MTFSEPPSGALPGTRLLSRDFIKYLAVFAMLLNHIAHVFLPPGTVLYEVFLNTGYFTAVTLCYFLVEGYQYTRSKKRYAARLLLFALLSQLPFSLALHTGNLNMLFTLLLCLLILVCRERIADPTRQSFAVFGLSLLTICSDWALLAAFFTILFDRARGSRDALKKAYLTDYLAFTLINILDYSSHGPFRTAVLRGLASGLGILVSGILILYFYNGARKNGTHLFQMVLLSVLSSASRSSARSQICSVLTEKKLEVFVMIWYDGSAVFILHQEMNDMVSFLSRFFIKNSEHYQDPEVRQAYGTLCGAVGIALNILLFAGKWLAGTLSGSIAITADAFNNLSDAGSSVITLIGFRLSGQKPDPEHPYGHGRMEYLSGLFVSVAILIMGFELIKSSIAKILHPEAIESSPLILAILAVSILVKVYMFFYNRQIGKKIDSAAMQATANDSLSDTISTTLVLVATVISQLTGILLDGWFGVLVGIFIFYTGITTVKETIDPLLGQPPAKEFVKEIEKIVLASPSVCGVHDLLVHDYGPGRLMISLHAEVPAHGDLLVIHDEIDNIERALAEQLNCSATIHMDPIITDDAETTNLRSTIVQLARSIHPELNIHDFRMVKGTTHTNLIFDVLIPYGDMPADETIVSELKQKISELPGGTYFAVIHVDHAYC